MNDAVKAFVSAVVYVHDSEATLLEFLEAIRTELVKNFSSVEMICVNDGSTDGSADVVRKVANLHNDVVCTLINLGSYQGREAAMRAGVDLAIGDYVIEFDDPILDFNPSTIRDLYDKLVQGFDIVGAAPAAKRRLTSKLFYKAINSSKAIANELDTERFRILSRRALNRVESSSQTIPYRKALYANSGLPQAIVVYQPLDGANAKTSKSQAKDDYRVDVAVEAMVLFTKTGYRISLGLAGFMMAVALFMVVYSIVCFASGITVAGWTTTILFLAFALFGLFGILAIVIKYLQIIVNLVFKKKSYTFESIERY